MAGDRPAGTARGPRHRKPRSGSGFTPGRSGRDGNGRQQPAPGWDQAAPGPHDDRPPAGGPDGARWPGPGYPQPGSPERTAPFMAGAPAAPARNGAASPAPARRRGAKARHRRKSPSFWAEMAFLVVIALVIALVVKTFVVQAFFIPSSSMENTLDIGDKVLVNKLVYRFRPIQPGDVVVFDGDGSWEPEPPAAKPSSDPLARLFDVTLDPLYRSILGLFGTAPGQTDFIKRVIGVPGDHVACCNASGDVTVNGVALHEQSYLYPGNPPSTQRFSITVPPGRLWVMGDHRNVSWDSRGHMQYPGGGTIPESMVIGRAFMIVWPPSRWRILPIPSTFGQSGIDSAQGAAASLSAAAGPGSPYLPLGAGFVIAAPLTWAERRLRRRARSRGGRLGPVPLARRLTLGSRLLRGRMRHGRGLRGHD